MYKIEGVMEDIIKKAKTSKQKIILPESEDIRIIKAANYILENEIADIILIGKEEEILESCKNNNILLNKNAYILDHMSDKDHKKYVEKFYELRKHKNISMEDALKYMENKLYYANMMLYEKKADGIVCGSMSSTPDALRPALQIIKTKENIKNVSAFFLIQTKKKELGSEGLFIFADCGLIETPTIEQLHDIVYSSVKSYETLIGKDIPKVACLSYATKSNMENENVTKMRNLASKIKNEDINFIIDGELQLDAAIIKDVAKIKAPLSEIKGEANVLIFPDLQAGNIGYKLVQRFGDALAFGPITQGLRMPVNDLSRGCLVEEIIGTIAITCVQSIEGKKG